MPTRSPAHVQVSLPAAGDFYDVRTQAADNKFFDQLLCIKSSQNPNLGDNYAGAVATTRMHLQSPHRVLQ